LQGSRNGEAYPIRDDEDILRLFAARRADPACVLVHAVLSTAGFWGEDLSAVPGLEEAVSAHYAAIQKSGVRSVLEGMAGHA
jgi:tagaturonate reductase